MGGCRAAGRALRHSLAPQVPGVYGRRGSLFGVRHRRDDRRVHARERDAPASTAVPGPGAARDHIPDGDARRLLRCGLDALDVSEVPAASGDGPGFRERWVLDVGRLQPAPHRGEHDRSPERRRARACRARGDEPVLNARCTSPARADHWPSRFCSVSDRRSRGAFRGTVAAPIRRGFRSARDHGRARPAAGDDRRGDAFQLHGDS